MNKDLVFVVGCPRSGTSLLQMLLARSFAIAMPIETHIIPLFHRVLFLWGNLERPKNRQRLLAAIYDFVEIRMALGSGYRIAKLERFSLLATRPKAEAIVRRSRTYSELVRALFDAYAEVHEAARGGDKSAFYYPLDPDRIVQHAPDSKVIHIVRDGRDVALSWLKAWFGPASLANAAAMWRDHVRKKKDWGRAHPDRYLEIRYEDLVSAPTRVVAQIAEFLGEEVRSWDRSESIAEMAAGLADREEHAMLMEPVTPNNVEKWRAEMSPSDRRLFEFIAGKELLEFGYGTLDDRITLARQFSFTARILASKLTPIFSASHWRRLVQYALPAILGMVRLLGLPSPVIIARRLAPRTDRSRPARRIRSPAPRNGHE